MNDNRKRVNDLLTTPAAAALLTLSVSAITKMRMLGTGPAYLRLGGAIRYRRSDLEKWMDENVVQPRRRGRKLNQGCGERYIRSGCAATVSLRPP